MDLLINKTVPKKELLLCFHSSSINGYHHLLQTPMQPFFCVEDTTVYWGNLTNTAQKQCVDKLFWLRNSGLIVNSWYLHLSIQETQTTLLNRDSGMASVPLV